MGEPVVYRKSSFSGAECCVEVGILPATAHVRDTKDRSRPELVFPAGEWSAFVAGVQAGEFGPGVTNAAPATNR